MMRIIIACLLTMSTAFVSCAQDIDKADIPSVVLNTFKAKFSNAADVEWEIKGKTYEAEFEVQHTDYHAYFNESGKLISHQYEISKSQLPLPVLQAIHASYQSYHIDDSECIEKDGQKLYEVALEDGNLEREIIFSQDGKETAL